MKKMLALSLVLLPVFMQADGVLAWGTASPMDSEQEAEQVSFIEYHNRMAVFGPLHQVYERTETDAFYVGVEAWITEAIGSRHSSAIGEAELRFGYNLFYNKRDHLTPFAGGGFIKAYHHHRHREIPGIGYGVVGLLYDHEFNSIFTLGTNFKLMGGGAASHKKHHWGNYAVGVDLSIPMTFRFGNRRHWDFRIEPFNIYLHGKNSNVYYFGGRSTLGYRF
ncbi:MAG: hypothetical protein ABSA17_05625 [Rhabdochlamydiaceae bacterium]|jgi:hypothetical protein